MKIAKKNVKNAMKKLIAVLLAVSMCIPTNLIEVVSATTEESQQDMYTVTISDTEHGTISFDNNSDRSCQYSEGDEVNLLMEADDGYQIQSFTVVNTDTGATIASEETTDDTYSFTMPAKNLTVSGVFAAKEDSTEEETESTSEIISDDTSESTTGDTAHTGL